MRRGAWLLGLVALLAVPLPAQAQVPPVEVTAVDDLVAVSLDVPTLPQNVPLLGQATYDVVIQDLSGDNPQNRTDIYHSIRLVVELNETSRRGWNVFLGPNYFTPSNGGDTWSSFVIVQALPTIQQPFLQFTVRAILQSSLGTVRMDDQEVYARVLPFALMNVDVRVAPPRVGPFQEVQFPVEIENAGVYPDTYEITATGPPGWFVATQQRATLFPGERREIPINVQTPATRVFVPQETGVITVVVRSTTDPGVSIDRATVVILEGYFFPEYWAPILLLGAVLAGATTVHVREGRRRRAMEQGQPQPAEFTPAQAILLKDLKQRDPSRYKSIVATQKRAFRAKERAWARLRTRRETLERTLVERQHMQVRETKAEQRTRERGEREQARILARQRAELEREKAQRLKVLQAQHKREEARQRRVEAQQARMLDPQRRREERAKRLRERQLRAELAKRKRLAKIEERKRRVETERRRRILERKKREMERRLKRRQGRAPKPPKERKKGRGRQGGDQGGEGGQGGQGEPGDPGAT